MNKDQIIKKIVIKAFELAKEESSKNSKNSWSKHIQDKLDIQTGSKTFTRVYNKYVLVEETSWTPSSETIDYLCQYIGFKNYSEFFNSCKIEVLVDRMSYDSLADLEVVQVNDYIKHLSRKQIKKRVENRFWLGVLLLQKCKYYKVIKHLGKCIDLNLGNEEYHYNLALAKFKGRRPFFLKGNEIKDVEVDITNAINLNPTKRKFYFLRFIIQKDYYKRRGFRITDEEILQEDLDAYTIDEIEHTRLLNTLNLPHNFN